ncbi:hypothetical protein PVL29_000630 [Vitis rotundifolia]|uniref:Aldehyde dehydrogenase domain-containing protein n=1 Tax=Vitis rotundifolia TaxID=103349 RepID=A0AA39ALQ2_VITRO|nr:hypothetical protein PVL29_000630 [Vitis rotundifolia]
MAAPKISSLLSRSVTSSSSALFSSIGRNSSRRRGIFRYSTAAAVEEPINPSVNLSYTQHLINGQFVDAASGKTFETLDPGTGNVIANVAEGDAEDVNRAVLAARKAFDEGPCPRMTPYHNDEIAALETWDNGKPYEQAAKVEVPLMIRLMRYHADYFLEFPTSNVSWKVGPALACGNGIVLKTAEQTPLSALYLSKLLHEVVHESNSSTALASHMDMDKLAFTGSTVTGNSVLQLAARSNLKPVTLELGGKSPFIVCEDANVDEAVELAHFALFFNQGQCCAACSRTFVHESIYDEFVEKAKTRALRRTVGDPFKAGIEQGPQIDSDQFEKILRYIRSGVENGGTLETGVEIFGNEGFFIKPTVFSNVQDGMLIAQDEIFGPVQSILKFKDLDEVIRRANAASYGLAAGVFTQNLDTANTLTRGLRVGTGWVNCFDVFDAAIPFGGYTMSGHGREKVIYSLQNYLQVKAVIASLKNPAWL